MFGLGMTGAYIDLMSKRSTDVGKELLADLS
jgi:hypothetical protein